MDEPNPSRKIRKIFSNQRLDRFFTPTPKNKASTSVPIVQEEIIVENTQGPQHTIRLRGKDVILQSDPGKREATAIFHPDDVERVRRTYIVIGPEQPILSVYPTTLISGKKRKFRHGYFSQYNEWLEYSESKDALFCLPCYLCKDVSKYGGEAFVGKEDGFRSWSKIGEALERHAKSEFHLASKAKCITLMNSKQSIRTCMNRQTEQEDTDYVMNLKTSLRATILLLRGGQAFRGHDEGKNSSYQGHFLEYVSELREIHGQPGCRKMTSPTIQKELSRACAFLSYEVLSGFFQL